MREVFSIGREERSRGPRFHEKTFSTRDFVNTFPIASEELRVAHSLAPWFSPRGFLCAIPGTYKIAHREKTPPRRIFI